MNTLVSVVIPMYNSEKYIRRCIESVINQSFKEIEIIIINDHSDDQSETIIMEYKNKYSNIRYIYNEKKFGPSYCRNIGLNNTKSKYVMFLDSDDWIDLNCILKAIEKFNSNEEIDIVLWEIKTALYDLKICERYKYNFDNVLTNIMALSLLSHTFTNEYFLSPLLGCKLFKTALLKNSSIKFIDTFYEDDIFSFLAIYNSRKIGIITGCCLYYYQHPASLTHNFSEKHVKDLFYSFNTLYEIIDFYQDFPKEMFYRYLQKSIFALLQRMHECCLSSIEISQYKAKILDEFYSYINVKEFYTYCDSLNI